MLDISWPDLLVLVAAALFILGPERMPEAARWLGSTVRKAREYVTGARDQMESEMGSDLAELRKPLESLAKLRGLDRGALTQQLLAATGGYDPRQDLRELTGLGSAGGGLGSAGGGAETGPSGRPEPSVPLALRHGERPPFDPDAT
ncbi:MAG TPA: twin-arginine translocase TatA/TatE family subunit [Pseudonocardiaceae bacterium]|jgi:sec-independent protein translocase protein TatB|nr:twin-arginine translocase TatA/TatE family subunit [Pseudonocardiaceae bacterium]